MGWQYSSFLLFLTEVTALHKKPYFLFPNVLKRWSCQRNCAGIWSFLYHQERWCFFIPENVTLFSRQKLKDDLSQKSRWKYIFFKCPEKIIFSKKSHWNMIFLVVLFGNMKLLFPENMILFFRWKMKDDISQKNTWKYNIFFKCPKKMVFPKIIALEYDLYYIIWKDGIFFRKTYFFFGWKIKDDLYQEIHENMIFSVYYV